jgi:hypothetical protein
VEVVDPEAVAVEDAGVEEVAEEEWVEVEVEVEVEDKLGHEDVLHL